MTRATVDEVNNHQDISLYRDDGSLLLRHNIRPNHRPYIHPIIAPDGAGVLTEDSPDHHPWQHGLYTGLNLVNGIGFWKEFDHDGRIDPRLVQGPETDGERVRWVLTSAWRTPDEADHLVTEFQHWKFFDKGTSYVLELEWKLQAEVDIVVGEYMAGGLFLRMPYREERGGTAYNSEGQVDEQAERQRARWVAVTMPIKGREDGAGMVLMDHPNNPDHPVTWRVDEQLGVSPSRCIAGSWNIPKGHKERYLYRIEVFCGDGTLGAIEKGWEEFVGQ